MVTASRTPLLIALAVVALTALPAARAGARVVAESVPGFEGGPALAGDGRVVVGERRGNGARRVLAIDPRTGAATQLTAFGAPADRSLYPSLAIAGDGGAVTATVKTYDRDLQQLPVAVRALTVVPVVAPLAACSGAPQIGPNLEAAGGAGFVATVRDDCGAGPSTVRVRTAAGTHAIGLAPVAGEVAVAPPAMYALRASGPMVGWIETHYPGGLASSSVVVARAATGQVLLRAPLPDAPLYFWALGSDGTAAFVTGSCAMTVIAPAAPALRAFALPVALCPVLGPDPNPVSVAAGRVVYAATSTGTPIADRYAVTDLQGAAHTLAEAVAQPGTVSQTAFDGSTVFVVRVDCDADRLLAIDADAPATLPPATRPTHADRCPLRRAGSARLRLAPDRRVTIKLRCAHGCRGTLRLVQQRRGRRERPVGQASYAASAGTLAVRPRIAGYARALAGCTGGIRVAAIVHPAGTGLGAAAGDLGRGAGTYRIVSRARCRHAGGPAFTKRQPGPRA
jgi:hypothetical protein